jgi:hypothetical protein
MNLPKIDLSEAVAALLARGEPLTAAQLAASTGKSISSISLAIKALGERVQRMGAARSSRYALKKDILGLPATQTLVWTKEDGLQTGIGSITYLSGERFLIELGANQHLTPANQLPWYLRPLKPQGYLGRNLMRGRLDMPQDPEQLNAVQTLYLNGAGLTDPPGAISVGEPTLRGYPPEGSGTLAMRLEHMEYMASSEVNLSMAKSSAGGEQPKFVAFWAEGQNRQQLVKFTPPLGTPFGERWKALLKLEHLAQTLLCEMEIESAHTQCFEGEKRFFLSSQRFDRIGMYGKRHVVAISALHEEFTPGRLVNWVHTAEGLHAKKLITEDELRTIAAIHAFGHYIGNTDMHFGNLSFFVDDIITPKIRLAPVYDMLPMMWRPDPHNGLSDSPVRQQHMPAGYATEQAQAREWAIEFWEQATLLDIGPDLQAAAMESARRLKNNFADA